MDETRDLSVIHLVWLPYGIEHFKKFVNSYVDHAASYPHELIIAFNGTAFHHLDEPANYIEYLKTKNVSSYKTIYFDGGQDIEIYRKAAKQLRTEYVLFLNSYSEILADNWLLKYVQNFDKSVGLIAATASLQSYYSSVFQKNTRTWETKKGLIYNFTKFKLFFKAYFYWRFLFKPFPNPHTRSNAFLVRRKEFLAMRTGAITSKFRAYLFENGRQSLTNYYLKLGMKVLVVDKNGNTFEPGKWKLSLTFWISKQENLLVSDNQAKLYNEADTAEKISMTKLAWGNDE